MNRLQKKCIIASTGLHLLLALILLIGPGFLSSKSKEDKPPLDFIPLATIDGAMSGGGDNTVKDPPAALATPPAPPAPIAPVTPVAPPVESTPTPPVVERTPPTPAPRETQVKPAKSDDIPAEAPKHTHKIVVNTTPVIGSTVDEKAARDAQAKAAANAQRRAALALSRTIAGIRGGVSGSTEVRLKGPGGGGIPYGNFLKAVEKAYYDAWVVPDGVPDVIVRVTVTIARDGTVISASITDESGNAAVDHSVQNTLDRVKFAAPLPESEKADQRTVTIGFNTETKASV
jgi:TonB family protein